MQNEEWRLRGQGERDPTASSVYQNQPSEIKGNKRRRPEFITSIKYDCGLIPHRGELVIFITTRDTISIMWPSLSFYEFGAAQALSGARARKPPLQLE